MLPHPNAKVKDRGCANPTGRRAGDHVAKLCCRGREDRRQHVRKDGEWAAVLPHSDAEVAKTEAAQIQQDEEQATMSRSSTAEVEKTDVSMSGRTGSEQPCCRIPMPRSRRPRLR